MLACKLFFAVLCGLCLGFSDGFASAPGALLGRSALGLRPPFAVRTPLEKMSVCPRREFAGQTSMSAAGEGGEVRLLEESSTRRRALEQLVGVLIAAGASGASPVSAAEPEITAKVFMDLKFQGRTKALENAKWEKIIARDSRASGGSGKDSTARIVIGLYGKEAPKTVDTFMQLIQGQLKAECIDQDDAFDEEAFGVSDRDKLTKKQIYKQCKAKEDTPLSYKYSQVSRVEKGKRIELGSFNKLYMASPMNEDSNALVHSLGAVSTKRGGGDFVFTIAPGENPNLDKENIVFGKVIDGLEVVDLLNTTPVSQGQFLEGAFKLSAKAIGDVRSRGTGKGKPLQKITVTECGVL